MGLMAPPRVHGRDARHSVREARRHHAESAEHLNFISLAAIPSHEALEQCMEGRQEKKRRVFSPPPPAKHCIDEMRADPGYGEDLLDDE